MRTLYWRATDPELRLLSTVDWASSYYYAFLQVFFASFWEGNFPKNARRIFHQHYNEIRSIVPPENLLEYHISQGWQPLCEFLGDEIPYGVPFPCINDSDSFVTRCKRRNRRQMLNVAFRWLVFAAVVCVLLIWVSYLFLRSLE